MHTQRYTKRLPCIDIVNIGTIVVGELLSHRCAEPGPRHFVLSRPAFPLIAADKALKFRIDGGCRVIVELGVTRKELCNALCLSFKAEWLNEVELR